VEAARQALSRSLVKPFVGEDGKLKVVALDPSIEEEINKAYQPQTQAASVSLMPSISRRVLEGVRTVMGDQVAVVSPVLLCSTPARFYLRRLLEPVLPRVVVLSPAEIPAAIGVQAIGVVR
jgi:flagellar biosynthesis protein FlhA